MIKKLRLKNFGKFCGEEFALEDVTVFLGRNEAGKTTLFDALFYALCRPPANKKTGRELKERYGMELVVELSPPREKATFDDDEFLSLYAIRSGDINLELGASSSWMQRVKARLFTGGIDPAKLCRTFEGLSSTKGSLKHNKKHKALTEENLALKEKLAALRTKRLQFLDREQQTEANRGEVSVLQQQLAAGKGELNAVTTRLEQLKKARERSGLHKILGELNQAAARRMQLSGMVAFKVNRSRELDKLQELCGELARKLELARDKEQSQSRQLGELENRLLLQEQALKNQQALAALAGEYLNHLASFAAQSPGKKVVMWHKGLLALAVLPLAGGVLGVLLPGNGLLRLLFPLCGVLVAMLLVLLARRVKTVKDEEAERRFLERLKDDWQNRGNPPLNAAAFQGVHDELQGLRRQADFLAERLQEYTAEKVHQQSSLVTLRQESGRLQGELEKETRGLSGWLSDQGVHTRDEYLQRTVEYANLLRREEQWSRELKEMMQNYHQSDPAQFEWYLKEKLRELETELPPGLEATRIEVGQLEKEAARLRQALETLQQRYGTLTVTTARETGHLSASLGSLTGEIATLDNNIEENKKKIARQEQQRQAAGLALEIFNQLALDTESIMLQLSRELAGQFGKVVPDLREVEVGGLETSAIRISDQGGVKRGVEQLSRGTRDSFLLAARLALARRAGEGEGIIVLDEPFYALDRERIITCLAMLAEFRADTGWQIVLLTKDEELARRMSTQFAGAMVHNLTPAAAPANGKSVDKKSAGNRSRSSRRTLPEADAPAAIADKN